MAQSITALRKALREAVVKDLMDYCTSKGEDARLTKSQQFMYPAVDAEGNEHYVVITVSIPTGERPDKATGKGGCAYDGYDAADAYAESVAEKKAKAEEVAAKKAAKIAKDKADREARAKSIAEHQKGA